MSLCRDLLRVSEINRIMRDRLDFICDVEVDESMYEPAELPRRVTLVMVYKGQPIRDIV